MAVLLPSNLLILERTVKLNYHHIQVMVILNFSEMARTKSFNESEVLEKALNLFWTKGFNATSIQDLVDHLGINRASLYDTWGDKQNLYMESLKLYRKGTSSWLLSLVRSNKPAKQIIQEFLNYAIEDSIADKEQKGCFLVNSTTELANQDQSINGLVKENRETVIKVLTAIIDEGKQDGEITSHRSSHDLATYLFGIINGIRVMGQTQIEASALKNIADIAISTLD